MVAPIDSPTTTPTSCRSINSNSKLATRNDVAGLLAINATNADDHCATYQQSHCHEDTDDDDIEISPPTSNRWFRTAVVLFSELLQAV